MAKVENVFNINVMIFSETLRLINFVSFIYNENVILKI